MASGRSCGRHQHVPNEEVTYHERSIQDVMNEDLQRQIAELTQHLATQNLVMCRGIDSRDLESNFENWYHNSILVRDEWHGDLGFKVKFLEFPGTLIALTVVSKFQTHLLNPSHAEEENKFIQERIFCRLSLSINL
jgi:hypothetical protein